MTLRTATMIAVGGVSLHLLVGLIDRVYLFGTEKLVLDFRFAVWSFDTLTFSGSILIFLLVLHKRQGKAT